MTCGWTFYDFIKLRFRKGRRGKRDQIEVWGAVRPIRWKDHCLMMIGEAFLRPGLVLGCKNWRHIHGWKFGPTFAHFPLSFPVAQESGTVSAGSIGGKNLTKRFSFVSVKGGGELLPAPSMKEAMPHDAQRSAPGSRTQEPIECYAKFRKLVLIETVTKKSISIG